MNLMHGDCLEMMKLIPDGSVDAIICDPPYGTVRGAGLDGWDVEKTAWDEAIEPSILFAECNRILRTNGALVLFAQDPYTARLTMEAHPNVPFSYRLTWLKDHFANALLAKKAPVNYTEDVCVFFKKHTKHDFEGFHPLRPYAEKIFAYIAKTKAEIFEKLGGQGACHFMRYTSTQFSLCTEHTYNALTEHFGIDSMRGFIPYEDLVPVDREYRENLIERMTSASPKVFNLPTGAKYKSNVLEYRKDYMGLHPTQKPIALMEDLILTYTNEGDIVLDFTMGSGTTGVAAANTGRKFIGIERDDKYFAIAQKRVEDAFYGDLI